MTLKNQRPTTQREERGFVTLMASIRTLLTMRQASACILLRMVNHRLGTKGNKEEEEEEEVQKQPSREWSRRTFVFVVLFHDETCLFGRLFDLRPRDLHQRRSRLVHIELADLRFYQPVVISSKRNHARVDPLLTIVKVFRDRDLRYEVHPSQSTFLTRPKPCNNNNNNDNDNDNCNSGPSSPLPLLLLCSVCEREEKKRREKLRR